MDTLSLMEQVPEADLFALGRILHDWTEEKILTLLGRIHDRLPAGGAVLIAEKLLLDDKSGPRWAQMQNLNMLTCTEGKERTLGEYERLLREAGFKDVQGCRTSAPLDAVLAVKTVRSTPAAAEQPGVLSRRFPAGETLHRMNSRPPPECETAVPAEGRWVVIQRADLNGRHQSPERPNAGISCVCDVGQGIVGL